VSPTATAASVVVDERFSGPPQTANGGYACGVVARFVDGPAEVTLRRPVPLERPLDARRHDDGSVTLHDRGVLLAEAGPALPLDLEPPRRPTVAEAREAVRHSWKRRPELFSHCYVCAPERLDGLGIGFGALPSDPSLNAAAFVADATAPNKDGVLAPEIVWAALDCPSYTPGLWAHGRPSLLARMTAELIEPIHVGQPVVAVGWSLGGDGRKHHSASALLGADGRTLALARTLWIRLRAVA
jgi:hypothetical protein